MPRGGTAVLQGNAGKIEKSSKYLCKQPDQERNTFAVSVPHNLKLSGSAEPSNLRIGQKMFHAVCFF
jgi:hypothetical protein